MRNHKAFLFPLCLTFTLIFAAKSGAAESPPLRKIRAAFTLLSGSMAPPWVAHEASIFRKHGLEVEVIAMPSGIEGMNALIAGEVQFLQIAGGTTVSAALGGAAPGEGLRDQPLRHFDRYRGADRAAPFRSRAGKGCRHCAGR